MRYFSTEEGRYGDKEYVPNVPNIIRDSVIALIVLVLVFGSFGVISAGYRGVKTRLGAVVGVVEPGLYFKIPLIECMKVMDVHTQSLTASKESPLSAASNDLQDTKLAVVVNYHINPEDAAKIYQQYGSTDTYYTSIVDPLIVSTLKAVASQYTAADQIQKRSAMSAQALSTLQDAFKDKGVAIEKADITDISFSEAFTQAIEAKVTAVQNAEAAQNKLAQVQAEAQQTVAKAQADAEAIRIQAQAINSQGGADYVALQAIQKWNGKYPDTYLGSANAVPLISIK
jgi:regulator of protease activity HflC (stomatin/prohibitin superfamily)